MSLQEKMIYLKQFFIFNKYCLENPLVVFMSSSLPTFVDYLRSLNTSSEIEIDITKPLKFYLRSSEMVFKQVKLKIYIFI
jgi:hypothetical protein